MDDVAAIQRGLEQLDRLRASRNGHAGLKYPLVDKSDMIDLGSPINPARL